MDTPVSESKKSAQTAKARKGFSLQFASDIHIEYQLNVPIDVIVRQTIVPKAKYLALCGDIGIATAMAAEDSIGLTADARLFQLKSYLHAVAEMFERVFYVAGNHEFYNYCIDHLGPLAKQQAAEGKSLPLPSPIAFRDVKTLIRHICETGPRAADGTPKLVFMDKTEFETPEKVRILGCTLWTHVPKHAEGPVKYSMTDYDLMWPDQEKRPEEACATSAVDSTATKELASAAVAQEEAADGDTEEEWGPPCGLHEEPAVAGVGPSIDIDTILKAEISSTDERWILAARADKNFKGVQAAHDDEYGWLAARVGQGETPIVVLTHHPPTAHGIIEKKHLLGPRNPLGHAMANSYEHLFAEFNDEFRRSESGVLPGMRTNSQVCAWLFGHTHHNVTTTSHGTVLCTNQRGYVPASTSVDEVPEHVTGDHFSRAKVLTVDAKKGGWTVHVEQLEVPSLCLEK